MTAFGGIVSSMRAGHDTTASCRYRPRFAMCRFFHPDFTVGSGVSPDHASVTGTRVSRETSGRRPSARGLYRRWGITPRPEDRLITGIIPTRERFCQSSARTGEGGIILSRRAKPTSSSTWSVIPGTLKSFCTKSPAAPLDTALSPSGDRSIVQARGVW